MLFLEFEIQDFGIYAGSTLFELAGRPKAGAVPPTVLIGGKNGAGKTTFLEALRLCLYGRLSFPGGTSDGEFDEYLRSRIHRSKSGSVPVYGAKLALTFQHAERGVRVQYRLVRRWRADDGGAGKVTEEFDVYRDGQLMKDLDSHHWNDFIEDLIPVGVSRLFFFDGEQIQSLADDETADADLAKSLKTMLGLDLVERVRADLNHLQVRELKKGSADQDVRALETVEGARLGAQAELAAKEHEREAKAADLAIARAQAAGAEEELRARGGKFAAAREELLVERGALQARVETQAAEAKKLLDGTIALAFCPSLMNRTFGQLEAEDQLRADRVLRDRLDSVANEVGASLKREATALRLEQPHGVVLANWVSDQIRASVPSSPQEAEAVHDLSQSEVNQFRRWFEEAGTAAERGRALEQDVGRTDRAQREVETHLAMAPDEETLAESFEVVAGCRTRVALLEEQKAALEMEERDAITVLARAQREYEKLTGRLKDRGAVRDRLRLAQRSVEAMAEYQRLLTLKKVAALEARVQTRFATLARKDDLVRRVTIDPVTFQVHLFDLEDRRIPRGDLSAGEKQIYAIAVLWGLADVSGRPLPMIVDTPLGRLDSDHRKNLIENYFPDVSHQVVILSTDTEVDQELFEVLEDDISHAYLLQAGDQGTSTQLSEGYFWQGGAQ